MTREEKLEKILEMSKEIIKLEGDKITDNEIDEIYIKTKFMLETLKELSDNEND